MGAHCWHLVVDPVVDQESEEVDEIAGGVGNDLDLEAGLGEEDPRSQVFVDGHTPGQLD